MERSKAEAVIEAILFTMGDSVEISRLAEVIEEDVKTTKSILKDMAARYEEENRGIGLTQFDDSVQLCTKADMYEYLIKIAKTPRKMTLTDTVLETLSIIAYKQPVTRLEIERVRGVSCDHAINKLLEYDLITELGRLDAPGRPLLFGTTEQFLRCFGVKSLEELPESWLNFQNFIDAFNRANMGRAYLNSAIILVFVLLGSVLVGTQLAYVLNRFKFPGNGLIRSLFLFATLLPGIAMQVSVYQIMSNLGFINHLYGYIIMSMGTDVISIYIFIQFMENISVSLDESAFIDGASYFTIYWKIILPLLKPAIVTSMVLKGVGVYNEYYCASLYLQDKRTLGVVATSLYTFTGPLGSKYNLICAGVLMSLLPALIVFLLCQKQIYSGITSGAVKG